MFDTPKEKIRKWLEKKIEGSDKAIDHGWEITVLDDGGLVIDTDQMPFKIILNFGEELVHIAFLTTIYTKGMDPAITEPAFRELLRKNREIGLTNFFLIAEEDDRLAMRTDLYLEHINKEEFNAALEATILGGRWLITWLGESEDDNRIGKEMAELGSAELLKGTAPEQVSAKMVQAGYTQEKADALVESLMMQLGLKERPEPAPAEKIEPAKDDTSAVDNYIW